MIHHVYANQSNIGDWLSAIGIQALLNCGPVQEHFCDLPYADQTIAALRACDKDDLIVIGGGGLFMHYFSPFWMKFREIAHRTPFCLWGVGSCDHKSADSSLPSDLLEEIVDRSALCIVRDDLTRNAVKSQKVPPAVPCPTFAAIAGSDSRREGILYVDHYALLGEENYQKLVAAAQSFAAATKKSYRQINNTIPRGSKSALNRCLQFYASADIVLTSRLHGCIIAVAMGRPVLAVSGDRKIESFMSLAGLSEWVCAPEDAGSIGDRLAALSLQPDSSAFADTVRTSLRRVAENVRLLAPANLFAEI